MLSVKCLARQSQKSSDLKFISRTQISWLFTRSRKPGWITVKVISGAKKGRSETAFQIDPMRVRHLPIFVIFRYSISISMLWRHIQNLYWANCKAWGDFESTTIFFQLVTWTVSKGIASPRYIARVSIFLGKNIGVIEFGTDDGPN